MQIERFSFSDINGSVHVVFVMGKTRVAPLKVMTIPRLKLAAAVLPAKVDRMLKEELELVLDDSVFWTDSTSVLKYILNHTSRFQTYVANRVSTIRNLSHKFQWRYVNSAANPADDASRGVRSSSFKNDGRWLRGPEYLKSPAADWPVLPQESLCISDSDPEIKRTTVVFTITVANSTPFSRLVEHFSSWEKLRRATAWLLKCRNMLLYLSQKRKETAAFFIQHPKPQEVLNNHMIKIKSQLGAQTLSVEDLVLAEESLVHHVQQQSFQDEITLLSKGHAVKTSSRMYKLDPILDNGILRVGGRLSRMAMPEEFKHPAILPNESRLCRLLMDHIHKRSGHFGGSQLLAKLHKRYWITRGKSKSQKVKVSFIVNSATCTVHTYREFKLRYSLTPWCIQITLNTNSRTQKYR